MTIQRLSIAFFLFSTAFLTATGWELLLATANALASEIKHLPRAELSTPLSATTRIYANDGKLIYEIHGDINRQLIRIEDVPEYLLSAFLASEDQTFFDHRGFSTQAIIRAAKVDWQNKSFLEGGSTITQQLARSLGLSAQKTIWRKLKEVLLALLLEAKYSKREILQRYLNQVPMGFNLVGIGTGSRIYFGKAISDLNLAESAYLAALVNAPTKLNPHTNKDELRKRAGIVLQQMLDAGLIFQEEYDQARGSLSAISFLPYSETLTYPYFSMYVRGFLEEKFGAGFVQSSGLEVKTTLDSSLQILAEQVLREEFEKVGPKYKASNAALLAVNSQTGDILAMVGGTSFESSQVNLTTAPRHPGSAIKPLIYLQIFERGFSPQTVILDEYEDFGQGYVPTNYGGNVSGKWVTMRRALVASLNIPAVRTLRKAGVESAVVSLKNFGLTSLGEREYGLSLALGAAEIPMLELAQGFSVLANGGRMVEIRPILKIVNGEDKVLLDQSSPQVGSLVADPEAVAMVNSILSDYKEKEKVYGRGRLFKNYTLSDRPVAAKTGTSSGPKDTWLVGYTPSLLTIVWVGNNDGSNMRADADGINLAAPIWHAFMEKSLEGMSAEGFQGYDEIKLEGEFKWLK